MTNKNNVCIDNGIQIIIDKIKVDEYYSRIESAKLLGISPQTLDKRRLNKEIGFIDGPIRFTGQHLIDYLLKTSRSSNGN
jgi:hypothetical protein